jgi:hypothetical protein
MVFYAIIGLIFILLIVFSVMSSKDWHWVNIVFLVLTYLAGVAATIALAQVFSLRSNAMKKYQDALTSATTQEQAADVAINGEANSVEYDPESLQGANQLLNLAMLGRGRVWSGGAMTIEDPVRVFTFPEALPAIQNPNQSLEDVELFAFLEGTIEGQVYPVSFIGKVRVTEQSPESLKLEDVFISNPREFLTPSGQWALFEKMPIDRHGSFRAVENMTDDETFDISQFRQILMTKYLTPQLVNLAADSAEYEKLIDRFAFDGLSMGTIENWLVTQPNRISSRFEPLPEELMVKFEFKGKSNRSYPVDFDGSLDTDGPFTPLGLAVDPTLHAGKEIEFATGDTILIDQLTADGYTRGDGTTIQKFDQTENVSKVDTIFVRQLRDFPFLLADLQTRTERLDRETIRLQDNNAIQDKTLADTENQINERTRLKLAIDSDNESLENDLDSILALAERLEKEVQANKLKVQDLQQQAEGSRRYLESQSRSVLNTNY